MKYGTENPAENFVINVLEKKRNGSFVEIGSNHFKDQSNTFYLESELGWSGIAVELDKDLADEYNQNRKSKCIQGDAMRLDYRYHFNKNNMPKQIDFLQIDIDMSPKHSNLFALIALPLTEYRFSVIVIEHGDIMFPGNKAMVEAQRYILESLGYQIVRYTGVDDYWVDPNSVMPDLYSSLYGYGNLYSGPSAGWDD
jgi:hypothetical protein